MGKPSDGAPTTDPKTNQAIQSISAQLGMSHKDSLQLLVQLGAAEVAKNMGARAMTNPNNSIVGAGSDAKSAPKKLLGHELTHALSQGSVDKSINDLERAAQKNAFFIRKANASSDASNR